MGYVDKFVLYLIAGGINRKGGGNINILKNIVLIIYGFSSGVVISGAVFAFIAIIGIVPRLAQKTKTIKYILFYEEAIIFGGLFGAATMVFDMRIPVGKFVAGLFAACVGMFYGSLAICLTETLGVIPITVRRVGLKTGLAMFICSLAVGKMVGSLLYFLVPGFY